jgi:hypothetical protein
MPRIKIIKPYFQTIKRSSEPLDLIHLYISDLKFVQTTCRKKYYIAYNKQLHNVLLYLFAYK